MPRQGPRTRATAHESVFPAGTQARALAFSASQTHQPLAQELPFTPGPHLCSVRSALGLLVSTSCDGTFSVGREALRTQGPEWEQRRGEHPRFPTPSGPHGCSSTEHLCSPDGQGTKERFFPHPGRLVFKRLSLPPGASETPTPRHRTKKNKPLPSAPYTLAFLLIWPKKERGPVHGESGTSVRWL